MSSNNSPIKKNVESKIKGTKNQISNTRAVNKSQLQTVTTTLKVNLDLTRILAL
jgi:hypothetical protein